MRILVVLYPLSPSKIKTQVKNKLEKKNKNYKILVYVNVEKAMYLSKNESFAGIRGWDI